MQYFFLTFLVHEIWTTLAADGSKGPFFVRTKNAKLKADVFQNENDAYLCYVPVLKSEKARDSTPAERGMLAYIYYNVNISRYLRIGDVLLFDGEKSFQTPAVKRMLRQYGIIGIVIKPSELHQLLSPADNHFHALFKLAYYRLLSHQNVSSMTDEEKLKLALQCYRAIDGETVVSMFRKCGLLADPRQDLETTLWKLISEGIGAVEKCQSHRRNLLCFLRWCLQNKKTNLCGAINEILLTSIGIKLRQ
jgi:hypothetical protein